MALGGGNFTAQNKVLAGTYINFISLANASDSLSERGFATMPLIMDWGVENEVFTLTYTDFMENSKDYFGYDYTHSSLKGLRDLFLNIHTLYGYRINSGECATATFTDTTLATAKYSGICGNNLSITIASNLDDDTLFDVEIYYNNIIVDVQTVASSEELIDNNYVIFNKTTPLEITAGIAFEGGLNNEITAECHQKYLDKIQAYSFNVMGLACDDNDIKELYTAFVKRMRDSVGIKFTLVLHNYSADFEGVINVKNNIIINDESLENLYDLVYWVTGIGAGCEVNKSCLNRAYNGNFEVDCDYTQSELISAITEGEFTLHKVGSESRILADINSLTTVTDDKGEDFKDNQVIRVLDQIANDIASLFNTKYLGNIPNDHSGRISLWTDIVKHHENLQTIRAIENFSSSDVVVQQGNDKKSVVFTDKIQVVNTMAQVYMTVSIG